MNQSVREEAHRGRWIAGLVIAGAFLFGAEVSAQETYRIYSANEYSADISVIDSATDTVIATIPISRSSRWWCVRAACQSVPTAT